MRVTTLYIDMNAEDIRDPVYTDTFRELPTLTQLDFMGYFKWCIEEEYYRLLEVWQAEMDVVRKEGEKRRLMEAKQNET